MLQQLQLQAQQLDQINKISNLCFDKCVPGKPGRSLDYRETDCVENCVGRFADLSRFMVERLREQQSQSGGMQ